MRKVVLAVGISVDGYIARPDGDVDFLSMAGDYSMAGFFATVDTAIMGRKTFEVGLKLSKGKFETYGLKTYVCSRTLPAGERDGLIYTAEPPEELIAKLRAKKGKNIWLMGGGELARDYLKADLVDEIHLGIVPALLGEGIPMFPAGFPQRDFKLIENETFSQGLIVVKYARVRPKAKKE